MRYRNRHDAGNRLADAIERSGVLDAREPCVVLGIPRGGIPVAAVIAERFACDLDVLVSRKIGMPGNPEFAIGAVAEDGTVIVDANLVARLGIGDAYVPAETERLRAAVEHRAADLRRGAPPIPIAGRTCVVVDDGVATGSTLEASLRLVRRAGASRVIAAVPVGPPETVARLGNAVDEIVCPLQPQHFSAVGAWYDDFTQVPDERVVEILSQARETSG